MNRIRLTALSLAATLLLAPAVAMADAVGYVDLEKVAGGYDKAQSFSADVKVKEAELRKMQADFVKQIEDARKSAPKNPVTGNQLEKDLNDKLSAKVREYRDWASTRQKEIDQALETSIKAAAKARSVDVVLPRQAVLNGGVDLTADVLSKLNAMP
ncbi:MAG: OmpH family outer membrane protein [Vampirovibrionales bacterium]|nr:OmpH family outer membrane protein [Vampirovibrionales bacterium]